MPEVLAAHSPFFHILLTGHSYTLWAKTCWQWSPCLRTVRKPIEDFVARTDGG